MDSIWEHIDRVNLMIASFKIQDEPLDCDEDCEICEFEIDGVCTKDGFDITRDDLNSLDICITELIKRLEERL